MFFSPEIIGIFDPKSSKNTEKPGKSGVNKECILIENLMETAGICRNSATKSA